MIRIGVSTRTSLTISDAIRVALGATEYVRPSFTKKTETFRLAPSPSDIKIGKDYKLIRMNGNEWRILFPPLDIRPFKVIEIKHHVFNDDGVLQFVLPPLVHRDLPVEKNVKGNTKMAKNTKKLIRVEKKPEVTVTDSAEINDAHQLLCAMKKKHGENLVFRVVGGELKIRFNEVNSFTFG